MYRCLCFGMVCIQPNAASLVNVVVTILPVALLFELLVRCLNYSSVHTVCYYLSFCIGILQMVCINKKMKRNKKISKLRSFFFSLIKNSFFFDKFFSIFILIQYHNTTTTMCSQNTTHLCLFFAK